mgnify:CR=1 FL=1
MKIFELKKDVIAPIHLEYGLYFSKDVCNLSYLLLNTDPLNKTVELALVVVSKANKNILHYLLRKTLPIDYTTNYFNLDGTLTAEGLVWGLMLPFGEETLGDYLVVVEVPDEVLEVVE